MLCIHCLSFRLCCAEVCQTIQAGTGLQPQQLFHVLPKLLHEVLPMASLMVGQADHDQRDRAKGEARDQIDEMNAAGASIVVRRCNVADKNDVEHLLSTGVEGLPPVRGVIHEAMVLHVRTLCSVFELSR